MSATTTTTIATTFAAVPDVGHSSALVASKPTRPRRRRLSTSYTGHRLLCHSPALPASLHALDLSDAAQPLVSLRIAVLSYLADLETRLSLFDAPPPFPTSPVTPADALLPEPALLEEARAWARDGLEMLAGIRDDVCASLPATYHYDFHLPRLEEVRSALVLPDLPDLHASAARLRDRYDGALDLAQAQTRSYVPVLSAHLDRLQAHVSSTNFPVALEMASLAPSGVLSELLDRLAGSELVEKYTGETKEQDSLLERTTKDLAKAVKQSMRGAKLIQYQDLPHAWRNNPFVSDGYRFIPLDKWPLIVLSLFALHNETLNIHTHFIPFLLKLSDSWSDSARSYDFIERTYLLFALLCLLSSTVWHTMAGCAHSKGMQISARVDYVGIGWLISASVGSVVYYAFKEQPQLKTAFLSLCAVSGVAGSVCPFMEWFNDRKYKTYRIMFFLAMAFTGLAPLLTLAYLTSPTQAYDFMRPVLPSLQCYLVGLIFYASHFPERWFAARWAHRLDWFGGGSHAIWHAWVVGAIWSWQAGMVALKKGVVV